MTATAIIVSLQIKFQHFSHYNAIIPFSVLTLQKLHAILIFPLLEPQPLWEINYELTGSHKKANQTTTKKPNHHPPNKQKHFKNPENTHKMCLIEDLKKVCCSSTELSNYQLWNTKGY